MIKYLSVCSGIEAASVAFHPLGWKPLAFSEIEAFPSAVLAHHYPTVPNLGDMTKWKSWDWEILADTDVLVGGPPCQAFSVAGLRAGLEDERGQLTISYIHLLDHIDEIRSLYGKEPAICLYENVPGILSSKDNAFGAFLAGFAGEDCELVPSGGKWIDAGCVYGPKRSVAWRVLDAQYFGVAQRRKRVFVIASVRDIDPSEILFEFDGLRRDTPPSRETWKGSAGTTGRSSTFKDTPILNDQGDSVMGVEDGLVGTLRRETHGHEPIVFEPGLAKRDGAENRFSNGVCGTLRAQMGDNQPAVAYSIIGDVTPKIGEDVCLTMRSQGGGIVPPSVAVTLLDRASFNQGENAQYDFEVTEDATTTPTLVARGPHAVGYAMQAIGEYADLNIASTCKSRDYKDATDPITYPIHDKATRHGGERGVANGQPSDPCLTLDTGGNHAVAIQGSMIGREDKNGPQGDGLNEEVSFTLNCVDRHAVAHVFKERGGCEGGGKGYLGKDELTVKVSCHQDQSVMTAMQVRRLTPTECERLQGFSDGWTDVPYRNKPAADGPRYKSLGNSMAVPVMNFIGRRINDALIRLGS